MMSVKTGTNELQPKEIFSDKARWPIRCGGVSENDSQQSAAGLRSRRIAFIILTWNSEKYIEECLNSVLGLEAGELLALVFDNGSADRTTQILETISSKDPRLVWTGSTENIGTTRSRNVLLTAVPEDFDFVCVLDSDTVVNQDAFDRMADVFALDPLVGVVGPSMRSSAGNPQLSARNLPTIVTKLGKIFPIPIIRNAAENSEVPDSVPDEEGLVDVGYLLSACWLIPMRVLDDVGPLDEGIFYAPEDIDWCLRANRCGYRVCYLPEAIIVHEYQRISRKRLLSHSNIEHMRGLVYYFHKHRYLIDASKAV